MWQRILSFALALVVSWPAFADNDTELTHSERTELLQFSTYLKSRCIQGMSKATRKPDPKAPAFVNDWLDEMMQPEAHCSCVADAFKARATPDILRTDDPAKVQALLKTVAQDCGVKRFKTTFPVFCAGMFSQLTGNAYADKTKNFCTCVSQKIKPLTGNDLAGFTKQTLAEYREYQKNPDMHIDSRSSSLLGYFMACGLADFKKSP